MATKLKKMKLTSVDLVRAGANQEADIRLYKSADPPGATESPTEPEKNIFKRFIAWLRENPSEAENEPQNHIKKTDLETIYKSALYESLQSIMQDPSITEIEKKSMTDQSIEQYRQKMREIESPDDDEEIDDDHFVDDYDDDGRIDEIEEDRFEEIEEIPPKKA